MTLDTRHSRYDNFPMDLIGATLFGRARYQVLAGLFALPANAGVHLRELARRTGLSPTATQYELRLLEQAGLAERDDSSGRVLYRVRTNHPVAAEVRSIIAKTRADAGAIVSDSDFWRRKRSAQRRDYRATATAKKSPFLGGRYAASAFEVDLGSR
jgi:DNA-binding transcriptional ArsR family regulator